MTAPTSPIVEAFSLSHVQVTDGATSFATLLAGVLASADGRDIYGVREATLAPKTSNYDNTGDDNVLSTWQWMDSADMTVQSGYLSFPLVSNLTGAPLSSSGSGAATTYGMDLWNESSFNVAPKPGLIVMPAKDALGAVRSLVIGLYRMQFGPMTFTGPKYKTGLDVSFDARCLSSLYDETGTPFADGKRRVGRLLSMPAL